MHAISGTDTTKDSGIAAWSWFEYYKEQTAHAAGDPAVKGSFSMAPPR